jgi:ATP-binding protein involved in chromosome partitioning
VKAEGTGPPATRIARFVVAVGSGKGGVGKSTVSLHLALAFRRRGLTVGLLDADLYGPDIPLMVGISRKEVTRYWQLWRKRGTRLEPVVRRGLRIMSVGFLLAEEQALTMPAPLLTAALRQLVHDVDWGDPDVLLIDLPPGTADLQQQLLGVTELDGGLVVVGPQDVAHLDGRRFLEFLRDGGVPILGGIENMSGLLCPHCGQPIEVFPRVADERSLWSDSLALFGRVPLQPQVGDDQEWQTSAFDVIAARTLEALEDRPAA